MRAENYFLEKYSSVAIGKTGNPTYQPPEVLNERTYLDNDMLESRATVEQMVACDFAACGYGLADPGNVMWEGAGGGGHARPAGGFRGIFGPGWSLR